MFRHSLYSAFRVCGFRLLCIGMICLVSSTGRADEQRVRFNRDVLPILANRCFTCHGFDSGARKADLRLDVRSAATTQLPSGTTAIVPGDSAGSELWRRISSVDPDLRMPPAGTGESLSAAEREVFKAWIEQGAEFEPHWALIPPERVTPPEIDGVSHPVDRFIRQRLQSAGLSPSTRADRATLIRRVTLDLTGLPPKPLEVDAFLNDAGPDAFERVVDRLLLSPHFGERWARWWLDLAHYGDSDGYLQDFLRPVAWRYRQWVVDAFNRDLPFDQFTIEQLAGDLLPDATESQRMGTGFLRNTLSNREGGADLEEYRVNQVLDRTITVGTTFLGLTIGCAQCHDHKFDAITQREFYQLYAFFNNADEANFNAPLPEERAAWTNAKPEYDRKRAELLAPVAEQLALLQADWEKNLLHTELHPEEDFAWERTLELLGLQWGQNLGEGQLEGFNIVKIPAELRTQDQQDRLLDYFLHASPAVYATRYQELKLGELTAKLDELAKSLPPVTRAPGMMSFPHRRRNHIHLRGEFRRKGDEVHATTPAALPPLVADGQPERLALARWLVSAGHPLTARVTVNRLWQELFGRGLVGTSENFGVRGDRPSHPELLDWLALEFQDRGWSIKSFLRELVLTETYQQSSVSRNEVAEADPRNTLLSRQTRLRLSAETVRDSALLVSDLLNPTIGGPGVKPPQPDSVSREAYSNKWESSTGPDRYRRGIYTFLQRTSPFAQFVTFDLPDLSRSCTRRERSNTPLQALTLLNDPVFLETAQALASRIQRESAADDDSRIAYGFLLVVSRSPSSEEAGRMRSFLSDQRAIFAAEPESVRELTSGLAAQTEPELVAMASVLLNLDEFLNRE